MEKFGFEDNDSSKTWQLGRFVLFWGTKFEAKIRLAKPMSALASKERNF